MPAKQHPIECIGCGLKLAAIHRRRRFLVSLSAATNPSVHLCDECVELCVDIIAEERASFDTRNGVRKAARRRWRAAYRDLAYMRYVVKVLRGELGRHRPLVERVQPGGA